MWVFGPQCLLHLGDWDFSRLQVTEPALSYVVIQIAKEHISYCVSCAQLPLLDKILPLTGSCYLGVDTN